MSLAHFDRDEDYGRGVYRRLVRLIVRDRHVVATIDDTHHAMWLLLGHDGSEVVSIAGAVERGPATTCGGAAPPLEGLIGAGLHGSAAEIAARIPPAANCTHLSDLARWSIRRAGATRPRSVEYAVAVPDDSGGDTWIEVVRDGATVHRWRIDGDTIAAPAGVGGRPLLRGFTRWASEMFDADGLEAAIMLQRGVWVARGRRYVVDRRIVPLRAAAGMRDACFSYGGANWEAATNNLGYVRDFTDGVIEHPLPDRVAAILRGDGHGTA